VNSPPPERTEALRAATGSESSQPWKLAVLLDAQSVDWQRGARTPVEDYLRKHSGTSDDPDLVLNLVYHEVLLRRRHCGQEPELSEYQARFPELADDLRIQFAIDQVLPDENQDLEAPGTIAAPRAALVEIPGYDMEEVLGRGGMGVVYRARHRSLNRTVALKMILDAVHSGARQANRFRSEAEVIARLQHPNIVQIHEIGEHDGRPFLALEFVEGGTLERRLAGTPMPADRAAGLVETLARAVQHAHERGVVHRDLKPANVLLDSRGEPKITDFGLAKLVAGDSGQTDSGALVGTPSYMAPEQVEGVPSAIGPSADVYALGAILYETLTGRPPFRAESPMATMLQVRGAEIVPPRKLRPNLPRDLETICLKSLEKDPLRRYPTAQALAEDLRRHREGWPIVARPVPAWEKLWLWARRQRALATGVFLGGAATLALLVGGVVHNFQLQRLNNYLSATNQQLAAARSSAEQNARDALAAISEMLVKVADQRLASVPEAEPVRRDLLNEALAKLGPLAARNPRDPEIRHEMGKSHLAIAAIHRSLGEYSRAIDQCRQALALLEAQPDNRLRDSAASAHAALADLLGPDGGRDHFLRAEALWSPLADDDRDIRVRLARLYYGVSPRLGGSPESGYNQAIAMLEPLARDDPQGFNRDLARAVHNLGLLQSKLGQQAPATANLRRALDLWEAVDPSRRTEEDDLGIIACQNALGLALQGQSAPESRHEAEGMLRKAVQSCERLARKHPGRLAHRDALARAWSNLGGFYFHAPRLADARPAYLQAVQAAESNVRDFPEADAQQVWLAHNLQALAAVDAGLGKRREAGDEFEKALTIVEPLVKKSPQDFFIQQCLATVLLNQANLVRDVQGPAAALPIQRRCVQSYEECRRANPADSYTLTCLVGARGNLCATLQQLGRIDEAIAELDRILGDIQPAERPNRRIERALLLIRAGRLDQAITDADALAREPGLRAESLYNLACVHALAVKAVADDRTLDSARKQELTRARTADAIRLIERSHRDAHFPTKDLLDLLAKDSDLEAIRKTPEFEALRKSVTP
jgi:serine/threonine-protein kinase